MSVAMRFRGVVTAALCLVALFAAVPASAGEAPSAITIDGLQYDGQAPYQLLDRPSKHQGLDTLLSRGRVKPEDLLAVAKQGAQVRVRGSDRTIFHDEYTGAEIWRLTNYTGGIVRHVYSGVPAWNANGRYILFELVTRGPWLFDQESCTQTAAGSGGQWSTTEPNTLFATTQWNGAPAVVAYDIAQHKPVRAIGPVRRYAGIAPVSADGKWVCWREGTQDEATTFGLAAADGNSYRGIATNGGIVAEQTPVTLAPLPEPPPLSVTKGGIHQMYFTRRPDHSVLTNVHGDAPHARMFTPDGKMIAGTENLTHQAWHPQGQYVLYTAEGGAMAMDPMTGKKWPIVKVAKQIEGHISWNSFDPDWAAMSWRTKFAGEVIRVSMRDDHSVARLCGSCPANPGTTAYDNDEFACVSTDGTKVMFMSTMSGSVNEYLVVAGNPRPPQLRGEWTAEGYKLTWTPHPVSRETKGYRIYRSDRSGQGYRQIAFVDKPATMAVDSIEPISFLVKDVRKGESAFFAVRAQEWSGLLSRYSNDVSSDEKAVATYIEPKTLQFTGFKQGFDPQNASDLYYLFVPKEGTTCSVSFANPNKDAQVWARVGGKNDGGGVSFTAGSAPIPAKNYVDWTWVNLGALSGTIEIKSQSAGFKLDRIFISLEKAQAPAGRGLDYQPDAAFAATAPAGVQGKAKGAFAAEITWQPVAGARYYNVYASDKVDFVPSQATLLYSPPAADPRAIDWGLKPATNYYYKVVAVDYDGSASKPSTAVEVKTDSIVPAQVEVAFAAGAGATNEDDPAAAGGKSILLAKGQTHQLKFQAPADGDYVFWYDFRADRGQPIRCALNLDGKAYQFQSTYDLAGLGGKVVGKDWVWSRYTFLWSPQYNGILHLSAGEHTMTITTQQAIHLDRMIITNDQSFVPAGKLCTF